MKASPSSRPTSTTTAASSCSHPAFPTTIEDDAGRILRAARRIADSRTRLPVQIGVNHGHVYTGEIGTSYRCTFTVMGDTVNLAARLMAAAPAGQILASPSVLDASATVFATTALEPIAVKGKSAPVAALRSGADRRAPITAPASCRSGPERRAADGAPCARGRDGSVVTVIGGAGIGKTRLVDEALLATPEVSPFVVRGEPYWSPSPTGRSAIRSGGCSAWKRCGRPRSGRAPAGGRATFRELVPYVPLLADIVHVDVEPTPR